MFLELKPMLRTWDLPGSIEFYTSVLGFECTGRNDEFGWAHLDKDGLSIMFSGPNDHEGDVKPAFTGSIYVTVDDVDAFFIRVKDRAKVCYSPETFDYGMREFAIYDNNGYLLQFGTPMGPVDED